MKQFYFFLLLFTFYSNYTFSQCPQGEYVINNVDEYNNYYFTYYSCTELNGSLIFNGTDGWLPGESTVFQNLETINGDLIIDASKVDNFPNLTTITGDFIIRFSDFTSFVLNNDGDLGMFSLETIGGDFRIQNNSNLVNFEGLENLTSVGGELSIGQSFFYVGDGNPSLTNLQGLDGLETVSSISIGDNQALTSVAGLGNLNHSYAMNIHHNTSLTSLDGIFIEGEIYFTDLRIGNNSNLTDISALSSFQTFGRLAISHNALNNLSGLENVAFINHFSIWQEFNLQNVDALQSINNFGDLTIFGCNNLQNIDGLSNVSNISGEVYIGQNNILTNLEALSSVNYNQLDLLKIINNQNLELCSNDFVCNYLTNGGQYEISNNAQGCNSYNEVIDLCNEQGSANKIEGLISLNVNNDDCNTSSSYVPVVRVEVTDGSNTFSTFSDNEGYYSIGLNDGSFDVTTSMLPEYYISNPESSTVTLSSENDIEEINFCISPESTNINDLLINIIPLSEARPGFNAEYQIIYKNIGTTTISNNLTLQFDDAMQTFVSASLTPDNTTANSLTFNYQDLLPFQTRTIDIVLNTFQPPTVNDGDILNFTATINSVANDATPEDNVYNLAQTVVNSYDPNDKRVLQGEQIGIDEVDKYLDYIVRFQNTGSASAINVRITDQLSDKLDWSTIQPISASHDYTTRITNGDIVEFKFEDINLPAEQDDAEGSNGFVAFRIKPKNDVVVGDFITGNASIYFDFNAPIITNTVSTEIVPENLSNQEFSLDNKVSIFPNPTNSIFEIKTRVDVTIQSVSVYNLTGEKLMTVSNTNKIDINEYASGMYFVKVNTDKGTINKRLIKK